MHPSLKPLADGFVGYLAERWEMPVVLKTIEQIPGGASRETYRVRVEAGGEIQGLILRRDPVSSLIDTERALEYQTYVAVWGTEVPVPEPLILEEDARHLERPFSVMREIPGCETGIPLLSTPPYDGLRETIGGNKWTLLGKLAAVAGGVRVLAVGERRDEGGRCDSGVARAAAGRPGRHEDGHGRRGHDVLRRLRHRGEGLARDLGRGSEPDHVDHSPAASGGFRPVRPPTAAPHF